MGTDDGTVEAVEADDDTASTDAERSLGDAAKDLVARSPESTARGAKFGAEFVTPTRLTGRKLAGPIVQPNVEYETPVKDSQVAHNPTSSVHDAKRLTMTLSDVERDLAKRFQRFQLPPADLAKLAEAVLAELANDTSVGDAETHSVCNRKC